MITPTQQNILDSLVNEFDRINKVTGSSGSFNFINPETLLDKSREIANNEAIAKADKLAWRQLAIAEADRLVVLLQQDLPNACIQRQAKDNGFTECPTIMIRRNINKSTHCDSRVDVHVGVHREWVEQSHECGYLKGVRLVYSKSWMDSHKDYDTMEEFVSKSDFQEQIRRKVL